ncbi:SMC domain protein [Caldicellulosiruptor acetigenus I77R1B]|uniref:SMC domain protein n=1 Tax=Caldicellulosiruptor acetigenus (strain ATCC 700853 / DSM 12137 / I77R1B) TaxID=632335 RepID=E4SA22_CALA7|nr:AAA family ATPase [Caldicellulosiruptor acetigenus]ADQ41107.1 SMC domain protein [Caldicellulosiruptor acetigenus I77R1B]WAM37310.1 ATP-dependent endonuclease [Caldicellulosiruptor acetigenus]
MYLNYLMVKNYKSLKELEIKFSKGKNIIIGRNNAGKSNIIKAIDLVLGEANPVYKNIRIDDFYYDKERNDFESKLMIYCDLRKSESENFEFEKANEERVFYVFNISSYKPTFNELERITEFFRDDDFSDRNGVDFEKKKFTWEQIIKNYQHYAFLFFAIRNCENLSKKLLFFVFDHSQQGTTSLYVYPYFPVIKNSLIKSFVMPSFRSPNEQLKLNNYSWSGKLFKNLIDKTSDNELKKIINALNIKSDIIFENIKSQIQNEIFVIGFPETDVNFQMCNDTIDDLYKNVEIFVDDGFKSELTQKGSGIQSAVIIDLFAFYTKHTTNKTSSLLCIEEPELFLHPHGCRVINKKINEFLYNTQNEEQPFNQVIMTTHNVEFLKGADKKSTIYIVTKVGNSTRAREIKLESYKHLLLDNNQNELFFAEKVILCEGYDMYLVKFVADEIMPYQLDLYNVSVIETGGKNNFIRYLELIKEKLGLKCAILADFDYLLRDEKRDENGRIVKKSNIEDIEKFFSDNKDIFVALKALRKKIKQKYPGEFEKAKHISSFENDKEIYYNLMQLINDLKKLGVFILYGEIEDLFIDEQVRNRYCDKEKNKLSLASILEINNDILGGGKKISEIINIKPIEELVKFVINI